MHDFTILALQDAYASSVCATLDMLAAAASLAARVQAPPPRWRLCSMLGGPLRLQGAMVLETVRLPAAGRGDRSVWVLPGLGLSAPGGVERRLAENDAQMAAAALARHVRLGGGVAASCSAVFLLNAAGLLQGRRVTTSWWLAPLLNQLAPACIVDADRMVCSDGPVVTAGAAFAQTDLVLHLLRQRCGIRLAELVSRMLLLDGRQAQSPYIVPEAMASGSDLVAWITARIESALPDCPTMGVLASELCMSERTLARHVCKATGKSTQALVLGVRLRRARALIEGSRMTVEQVAEAVGYQDATALRRAMKRLTGANPSRYRR